MIKTTFLVLTIGTVGMFNVVNDFQTTLPQPVEINKEDTRLADVRKTLTILGRDIKFAKDIYITATAKNIDPVFWACNIECESEFKRTAKSKLGYKGLGQTPHAIMKPGFDTVDLMIASCILDKKMSVAKGDMKLALALYKGGNNPAAKKEAAKVFRLYEKIKLQLEEQA